MEIPAIILLSLACAGLLWKWLRLRSGVTTLANTLESSDTSSPSNFTASPQEAKLARLSAAVATKIREATIRIDELKRDEKISSYLLNEMGDAVFIVDQNQEILYANRAVSTIFSATPPFAGSQLIEVCRNHVLVEAVSAALRIGSRIESQIGPTDANRVFRIEADRLPHAAGLDGGAWILVREITTEIHTEQVRKDFVANASHELRTPLAIITGYLELLADETDNKSIQIIQKHTGRITRIVEDMLTISKLEGGDPTSTLLNKKDFDLALLAHSTVDYLRPLIEETGAKVNLRVPPDGCKLFGDPFYFEQIFVNLIENALKQNPKPGLKIVVEISADSTAKQVVIEVRDNGIGIPASDLSSIFKRFYRVEKHHAQTIKGTGLGLSIVKRAVEAHGGTVEATSTPGKKTRFCIALPTDISHPT